MVEYIRMQAFQMAEFYSTLRYIQYIKKGGTSQAVQDRILS